MKLSRCFAIAVVLALLVGLAGALPAGADPPTDPVPPTCNSLPATIFVHETPDPDVLWSWDGTNWNSSTYTGTITGTSGDDVIVGSSYNDTIVGGDGNDTICGGDGDDEIHGGACNDVIYGVAGNDTIYGDGGNDTIHGGDDDDDLYGGDGNDFLYGDGGTGDEAWGDAGTDACSAETTHTCESADPTNDRTTICIKKDVDPEPDSKVFEFTGDLDCLFRLDDDASDTPWPEEQCFDVVALPGGTTYSVIETPEGGWDGWALTNVVFDGGSGHLWSPGLTQVSINATAGVAVNCTFENQPTGIIEVTKIAYPDGDTQEFDFTMYDGGMVSLGTFDLHDNEEDWSTELPWGDYYVVETVPSDWYLSGMSISDSIPSGSSSSVDRLTATATVRLDPGETVSCNFTDAKRGTITIVKDAIPDDPQDFEFSGDLLGFFLDDDDDGTLPNSETFSDQIPNTQYDVTETVPYFWDLTDIDIVESETQNSSSSGETATLMLDPDEAIVCTFENTKRGSIIVEKNTRGGPDGSFTFTGDVAGTIGGGGQLEEDNLVPGQYTVREHIPAGWELSSLRCDDDNSSGSVGTGTATINLDPGETVTCTYTNTYLAKIPGLPRKHPGAVGTPEPASVLACYLDVPVVEAMPGQQFDISVNLCNRGGEKATKSVDLLINGHQEQSQTVGLGPGACQTVVFRVFKMVPGTYQVSIMGQVGYFTIMPLYPGYVVREAPGQEAGGIGTAGIVTIVVVVIVLAGGLVLILRRE